MTTEEKRLTRDLVETVKTLSDPQDSHGRSFELRLKRLENDVDRLEIAIDHFHELLAIFDFEHREQNEERRPDATTTLKQSKSKESAN